MAEEINRPTDEAEAPETENQAVPEETAEATPQPKAEKKSGKPWFIALTAAIVAVALILGAAAGFLRREKPKEFLIYEESGNLFLTDGISETPLQLTENLWDDTLDEEKPLQAFLQVLVLMYVTQFDDAQTMVVYPDHLSLEAGTYQLYCRDLTDPEYTARLLDADVQYHFFAADGSCVAYYKGDTLFLHDFRETVVVTENAAQTVDEDTILLPGSGSILYKTQSEELFLFHPKNGSTRLEYVGTPVKAEKGVLIFSNDAAKSLYTLDPEAASLQPVAEQVTRYDIFGTDNVYYTRSSDALEMLYHYDGTREVILEERMVRGSISFAEDGSAALLRRMTAEAEEETLLLLGETVLSLGEGFDAPCELAKEGSAVYYLTGAEDAEVYDVFRREIHNGSLGEPELYASQVTPGQFSADGQLVFYRDIQEDGTGTMCVGEEVIAENACQNLLYEYFNGTEFWYYLTAHQVDDVRYTDLYVKKHGEEAQLVHSGLESRVMGYAVGDSLVFLLLEDDQVLRGTLMLYNVTTGKLQTLGENVSYWAMPVSMFREVMDS